MASVILCSIPSKSQDESLIKVWVYFFVLFNNNNNKKTFSWEFAVPTFTKEGK